MTIEEKLAANAHLIQHGDIALFRGSGFISKCIETLNHAYFSHSGLILKTDDQLFILDSTLDKKTNGVEVDFLNNCVKTEVDFVILRPNRDEATIKKALYNAIQKGVDGWKYNIWFYLQFLIYHFFKWDDTKITSKHSYVCSQFAQYYTDELNIPEYKSEVLITPQYIYDNINPQNIYIVVDKN